MIARAVLIACLTLLAVAPGAWGHALVVGTVPERGAQLDAPPAAVAFSFNEPVEASFGAVRVYDANGARVDDDRVERPEGAGSKGIGVGLRPGLGGGTYTATYRAISADGHPVSGGFVFTVGEGGATSGPTVGDLIDAGEAGPVTSVGFGVVRALAYGAIALAVGGVGFLLFSWRPALGVAAGPEDRWRAASTAFGGRLRALLAGAVLVGAATSALGIAFQGATASGTSLWSALDPDVVGQVLDTRFGTVWGLRLVAWCLAGVALTAAFRGRAALAAAALPLGFLVLSPALAGHASTQSPGWLLLPADVVHVAAMSVWTGGLAVLVGAMPAATARLEPGERTRILAATLRRFSPIALAAVAALALTGLTQSVVHVRSVGNLLDTAFGRAVLVKALVVVLGLVVLGAYQRRRSLPRLAALEAGGEAPGRAGVLLRRALRAEVALVAVVLGVTAALVSYAPSVAEQAGPFAGVTDVGPARLDVTVDPATPGSNEIHLYLTDPATGAQFSEFEEIDVALRLRSKEIGPIEAELLPAGPGHYVAAQAPFGVAGDWEMEVRLRLSEFEERSAALEVPIE